MHLWNEGDGYGDGEHDGSSDGDGDGDDDVGGPARDMVNVKRDRHGDIYQHYYIRLPISISFSLNYNYITQYRYEY